MTTIAYIIVLRSLSVYGKFRPMAEYRLLSSNGHFYGKAEVQLKCGKVAFWPYQEVQPQIPYSCLAPGVRP